MNSALDQQNNREIDIRGKINPSMILKLQYNLLYEFSSKPQQLTSKLLSCLIWLSHKSKVPTPLMDALN